MNWTKLYIVVLALAAWGFVFLITATANRPPHGGWGMNMQYWTMGAGEAVPEWFPMPLFHADSGVRQAEPPSRQEPEDLAIGVTTYAEYTNGATTLRMRVASGEIVSVDRSAVSVMPFAMAEDEVLYYRIGERPRCARETGGRFPVWIEGIIQRARDYETGVSDRVRIDGEFWNNDRTSGYADIIVLPDGTVQPGTVRIFLRGFAPRHMILLGMCAGYATIAAGVVFFFARVLSTKRPPAPPA